MYSPEGADGEPMGMLVTTKTNKPKIKRMRPASHLPNPAKPRHGVHLNLSGHQF